MITDTLTITWKELREFLIQRPNFRGGWTGIAIIIGVFGILLPLRSGARWVNSPISLIYFAWVPFMMVSSVVADAFAGERERHTLETLLASRLSDRAILFGKLLASIIYGWGLALVSLLLGLVTVNLTAGQGRFLFFPLWLFAAILGISFLITSLAATLGVLISLHAATVRQAQQTLSLVALLPLLPLILLPLLPSSTTAGIEKLLISGSPQTIVLSVCVFLVVVDVLLLAVSLTRFQRSKMILD